jgi:hypothetical protein
VSKKTPFPLPVEYGLERDVQINSSNLINLYSVPTDACSQKNCWVPVSGYIENQLVGDGPVRAQFVYRNILYLVSGTGVYTMDATETITLIGNIAALGGYVGITANEIQVIFIAGSIGYIFDINTSVFSTIAFGFPINPVDVLCWITIL